jgi:hypothetical protein
MHEVFDYDDVHLELENLTKDSGLIVGSISTPHGPFTFESIATSTLMKKQKSHGRF